MKSLLILTFTSSVLLVCCTICPQISYSRVSDDRITPLIGGDDSKLFLYEYTGDYISWGVDTLSGVNTNVDSINVSYPFSPSTTFYVKVALDSIRIIHELVDTSGTLELLFDDILKQGDYGFVLNGNFFDSGVYWLKSKYGGNKPIIKKFLLIK